jgi:peptidoglycan/LPS O-acetylase OafA/YrhL
MGLLLHRRWAAGGRFPRAPFWLLCLSLIVVFQIPGGPSKVRAGADLVSLFLVFPAVVWAGAHSAATGPVVRMSGRMSFPLYAIHWLPIVVGATFVDLTFHSKAINLAFLTCAMLALIGLALAAGHWDERLRSKVSPRRKTPLSAAAL